MAFSTPSRRWSWLKHLALLIPIPLVWAAFQGVEIREVWRLIRDIGSNAVWIVVPMAAAMLIDTTAWKLILQNLSRPAPFGRLLGARLATESVLLSVSGGAVLSDALAPYLLKRHWNVSLSAALASGAIRKCALFISQGIYLAVAVIVSYGLLKRASVSVVGREGLQWFAVGATLLILMAGVLLAVSLTSGGVLAALHRKLERLPGRRTRVVLRRLRHGFLKTDGSLSEYGEGSSSRWVGPVLLYCLVWLAESLETFLILRFLGVDVSFLHAFTIEAVVVLLRHAAFFIPGGLGVQELGYLAFIRALGIANPVEMTLAFSMLKRTREALWVVLGYTTFVATEGYFRLPELEHKEREVL